MGRPSQRMVCPFCCGAAHWSDEHQAWVHSDSAERIDRKDPRAIAHNYRETPIWGEPLDTYGLTMGL